MSFDTTENESMRRLRWQCRRGLLELDLLFARFLEECYGQLTKQEQTVFQELLRQPDHSLLAWLQGQEAPPSKLRNIIINIKQHIEYKNK